MTKESKNYLLKTILAIALMIVGAWGGHTQHGIGKILAGVCFLTGFVIMLLLYGDRWLDAW
jgi:hypothetical protein